MDSTSPHLSGDISLEGDKVYFTHHYAGASEPPLELGTDESFARVGFTKEREFSADYSDCPALHAEANALSVCDRAQREGGTIYTTSHVCFPCAKLVANAGLSTVVVRPVKIAEHRTPQNSYDFLESCGLTVVILEMDVT
jgi:deoxycytidylate deaminase